MKIKCDCRAVTKFVNGEDGTAYTEGEGWYKVGKGPIRITVSHYSAFLTCEKCGKKIWIFV